MPNHQRGYYLWANDPQPPIWDTAPGHCLGPHKRLSSLPQDTYSLLTGPKDLGFQHLPPDHPLPSGPAKEEDIPKGLCTQRSLLQDTAANTLQDYYRWTHRKD